MPVFSRALEKTLRKALALANERRHEYATLEHLLLALIDDPDAAAVLRACNVDLDQLRKNVVQYLDTDLDNLVVETIDEAKATAGFQRVVQRAAIHVQSSARPAVSWFSPRPGRRRAASRPARKSAVALSTFPAAPVTSTSA